MHLKYRVAAKNSRELKPIKDSLRITPRKCSYSQVIHSFKKQFLTILTNYEKNRTRSAVLANKQKIKNKKKPTLN